MQEFQREWKASNERKYLIQRNRQLANIAVRRKNSVAVSTTPLTSQIPVASSNNLDPIRDNDKDLLVLYLLPTYKLLNEEDKQEVLHQCYKVMKERHDSVDSQLIEQSEDQPQAPDVD